MPPAATSSSRALAAILPLIATSPYEAHQKARTFASRYVKSTQYDTAIDVLFQSARELLKAGQLGSGTDLTSFLLDVYEAKGETVGEESKSRLTQLIALTGSAGLWRKTMIDKSIAWTAKHGPCPAGDQNLHHYVGELLYKDGAFDKAEIHLLASGQRDSARLLSRMMVEWSSAGGSPGTFALRGTIPYLLNGNILAARTFIMQFVASLPSLHSSIQHNSLIVPSTIANTASEVILTTDPVVNFCQMAVLTCQCANGDRNKVTREAWVRLCGTYQNKGGLLATQEARSALNELATLYFAIPSPRNQAANPFGEMLSSLFGGPMTGAAQRRMLSPAKALGLD